MSIKQIENRNANLKIKYPLGELLQNYIVGRIKFKPSRADVLSHSISIRKLLAPVVLFPEQDEILGCLGRAQDTLDFCPDQSLKKTF